MRLEMTSTFLETDNVGEVVQTTAAYLARDPKHMAEKPYEIMYENDGVVPQTNMSLEYNQILVHNFRPYQSSRDLVEYGFTLAKINCSLTAADFDNEESITTTYYPIIEKVLSQNFPEAAMVKIMEHNVRKRHALFSIETKEVFEFDQPSTVVHTDYSPQSAGRTARAAFHISPAQYRRLITVNVWKSFHGPGNDWPLALCDWRTIDRRTESITADMVARETFTENERFYYSPEHKWYYFKDLQDDEVIIFQQTDSDLNGRGGVAHTSFYNSMADKDAAPRASIELRAFIFFT
ncbi:hypothetical protein B0O99DRAFT_743710 [Bisporella sp. PMI_857]|nr:hypothetical protein B0O99DRAFT_743710 [Bisporella sp. PMI_857]